MLNIDMHNRILIYTPGLNRTYESLGQRTNQAEKRDFLWLDTASLGTVSKFSKAVKQSVLDFNVQSSLP